MESSDIDRGVDLPVFKNQKEKENKAFRGKILDLGRLDKS